MYADPALIRKHVVKLNLNDKEFELLTAITNYTGGQLSVTVRNLTLQAALSVIQGDSTLTKSIGDAVENQCLNR